MKITKQKNKGKVRGDKCVQNVLLDKIMYVSGKLWGDKWKHLIVPSKSTTVVSWSNQIKSIISCIFRILLHSDYSGHKACEEYNGQSTIQTSDCWKVFQSTCLHFNLRDFWQLLYCFKTEAIVMPVNLSSNVFRLSWHAKFCNNKIYKSTTCVITFLEWRKYFLFWWWRQHRQ